MINFFKFIGLLAFCSVSSLFAQFEVEDASYRNCQNIRFNPALLDCNFQNHFAASVMPSPFGLNELSTFEANFIHKFNDSNFAGLAIKNLGFNLYHNFEMKTAWSVLLIPRIYTAVSLDYNNEYFKNYSSANYLKLNFGAYYNYSKFLALAFSINNIKLYHSLSSQLYTKFNSLISAKFNLDENFSISLTAKEFTDNDAMFFNFYYLLNNNFNFILGFSPSPSMLGCGININLYNTLALSVKFQYINNLGYSSLLGLDFDW